MNLRNSYVYNIKEMTKMKMIDFNFLISKVGTKHDAFVQYKISGIYCSKGMVTEGWVEGIGDKRILQALAEDVKPFYLPQSIYVPQSQAKGLWQTAKRHDTMKMYIF